MPDKRFDGDPSPATENATIGHHRQSFSNSGTFFRVSRRFGENGISPSAIKKHRIPGHAKIQESITRRQNRKLLVSRPKSMISPSRYMLCPGKVGKTSPNYVILGIDGDCTTRAPSQAHGLAQMQEQSTMQGRHGCDALSIARRIALIYAIMQGRYGCDAPALAWRAADDARTSRT